MHLMAPPDREQEQRFARIEERIVDVGRRITEVDRRVTELKEETSKSWTYGIVAQPLRSLTISADLYYIKLNNDVNYIPSHY